MDVEGLYDAINDAYKSMAEKTEAVYQAGIAYNDAKLDLEQKRAAGLAIEDDDDPRKIKGRNEDMREASAREKLPQEYALLEEATAVRDFAYHKLALAKLEKDRVDSILRLLEATA